MDTNEEEAGGTKEQLLQKNTVEQKQTIWIIWMVQCQMSREI